MVTNEDTWRLSVQCVLKWLKHTYLYVNLMLLMAAPKCNTCPELCWSNWSAANQQVSQIVLCQQFAVSLSLLESATCRQGEAPWCRLTLKATLTRRWQLAAFKKSLNVKYVAQIYDATPTLQTEELHASYIWGHCLNHLIFWCSSKEQKHNTEFAFLLTWPNLTYLNLNLKPID